MTEVIVFGDCSVNTLGLIRSIGEKGIPVSLMLGRGEKDDCYARFSKYVNKIYWLDTAMPAFFNDISAEDGKPIVLCSGDVQMALIDAHYEELKDKICAFNAFGESGRINFFMDKNQQLPVARRSGLATIKTWEIEDVDSIPHEITYPCIIKGNNSLHSGKDDLHVCQSRIELFNRLKRGSSYLVQEYIDKDFELDIMGFSYNHGRDVFIPAVVRKIRETLTRQSDYICLEDIRKHPMLNVEGIKVLVHEIGYEGIFSVEFVVKDNRYYFLEINLRNDGVGYLYSAAGINYPYLWVLYNTGKLTENLLQRITFKSPFYLMSEGDLFNVLAGKVSTVQWFRECLGADAHFRLNMHDMMPFIYSSCLHLKNKSMRLFSFIRLRSRRK